MEFIIDNRSILAVLAHPDDESFGMGGTLALYARKGVDVYLICATRGEAGEVDKKQILEFNSIGQMREAELSCAAGVLGLKGVFFLGYRDSGMPGSPGNQYPDALINHPIEEVACKIVKYFREIKPGIILTFDPIGGYRHPDHIHITKATTLAFHQSGKRSFHPELGEPYSPKKLYYHIIPKGSMKIAVIILRMLGKNPSRFGKNGDIDLASIAKETFPTHAKINIRSVMAIKDAASSCHSSQGGSRMRAGVMGWYRMLFGGIEYFMREYPPIGKGEKTKRDLFFD